MRIEKLEIKGFGKLKDRTFTFGEGLNIVFGKNESGKSSLQWFIKAMFFGLRGGKSSKDGLPPPLKKYRPWTAEEFNGFMEYTLSEGGRFRVERNFHANTARVYDDLYNDITSSFDITREKGVAFAEKQLGLNEACFDRTVLIRQMESRIDEDGSRELLNKLTNIRQTGFEDISFKKAQEALKEALKSHVGTEKTTKRPLDKVLVRMEELKARRLEAVKKRESMFSQEEELQQALASQKSMERKWSAVSRLKGFIEIKTEIRKKRKLLHSLEEIIRAIRKDREELETVHRKMADFAETTREFARFAAFDNEDIDRMERDYSKLLSLLDEKGKIQQELRRKQESLKKVEEWLEPRKAFNVETDNIEERAAVLLAKLEKLKKESGVQDGAVQNEKISLALGKRKLYRGVSVLFIILAAASGVLSFYQDILWFHTAIGFCLLAFAFAIPAILEGKRLKGLKSGQSLIFIHANTLRDEINQGEKELQTLYRSVGAENYEEFVRLKTDYSHYSQQAEGLRGDILRMEEVAQACESRRQELQASIGEKLNSAGLSLGEAKEIIDPGIRDFKYGVRRYLGIKPSINYSNQREEDLNASMETHFRNASVIIGCSCTTPEALEEKSRGLELEILGMEARCSQSRDEVIADLQQEGSLSSYITDYSEAYIDAHLDEIDTVTARESQTLEEGLKALALHIREVETRLEGLSSEEEELQRMDEEMTVLEQRKNRLEDMHISLKTALDMLTEASLEIQRDFAPALNIKMSEMIQRISGGRYRDLRADDRLALKTVAPETGDVVPALLLSGGTIDQMYLALRIGMCEMLTQGRENMPLFLDEVFAQYDDERTRETFRLLHDLRDDHQTLFFTCKSREVEIAREILGDSVHILTL